MGNLKIVGGPRDGGSYKAPDGYRETGYFGDIVLPYVENGETKYAVYKRAKEITPHKTIRFIDEIHFQGLR